MGREINLDSILALDAEIIRLKRTRNSLLNIARIPPEILGHIFRFNVAEVGDPYFAEIPKGSYNFLLVCHHWFQVALRTPAIWTSWGNDLKDWKRWYLRSGISTLDLILDEWRYKDGDFDEALQDTLRDRATRDVIRKVHLKSGDTELLAAIISSLIPEGEGVRPSSIESIVLSDMGTDVSDFFARHRFPKLRNLHLLGDFGISSWDHLKSATTALTNISLSTPVPPSAIPTVSQIFSLLTLNPNLRSLKLSVSSINDDSGDGPRLQVPLHHLEHISLSGSFHRVFPILHRLELPKGVDYGGITLHDCTPQGVLEVIGPYIQDYLRRVCVCVSIILHSARRPEESAIYYRITSDVIQGSEIGWGWLYCLPFVVSRFTPALLGLGFTVRIGYRSTARRMGALRLCFPNQLVTAQGRDYALTSSHFFRGKVSSASRRTSH